mmetsp:Transcript_17864/g.39400  ORF Transcript_17864/g.39400 Transcript_17864/m.39400 type:complete len:317 (-) Transcript_17864:2923-3873(-)
MLHCAASASLWRRGCARMRAVAFQSCHKQPPCHRASKAKPPLKLAHVSAYYPACFANFVKICSKEVWEMAASSIPRRSLARCSAPNAAGHDRTSTCHCPDGGTHWTTSTPAPISAARNRSNTERCSSYRRRVTKLEVTRTTAEAAAASAAGPPVRVSHHSRMVARWSCGVWASRSWTLARSSSPRAALRSWIASGAGCCNATDTTAFPPCSALICCTDPTLSSLPPPMMNIRVLSASASSILCVEISTALRPRADATPLITDHMNRLATGSMPLLGSSMKITGGSPMVAMATLSLRLFPPDRFFARTWAKRARSIS